MCYGDVFIPMLIYGFVVKASRFGLPLLNVDLHLKGSAERRMHSHFHFNFPVLFHPFSIAAALMCVLP